MNNLILKKGDDPIVSQNRIAKLLELQLKRAFRMPNLMDILNLLEEHEYMRVEDLADSLGKSKSITSQNLKKLSDVHLVKFRPDGKYHEFYINRPKMNFLLLISDLYCMRYGTTIRLEENKETLTKIAPLVGINAIPKHAKDYRDRYDWDAYEAKKLAKKNQPPLV